MVPPAVPLEVIVRSNEKLLKALITLLSLKDEHMLDELKTIFTYASRGGSEIGQADPAVWKEISRELTLIEALISDDGEESEHAEGAESAGVNLRVDEVH